jgi:arylformamidase
VAKRGEPTAGRGFLDVTRPLSSATPVWPGDVALALRTATAGGVLVSSFTATCHLGTHLDTPRHLDPAGVGVDGVPLTRLVGPAEVVTVPGRPRLVALGDLPYRFAPRHPRLLLRTDSHPVGTPIGADFAALDPALVPWLVERGVELVGIDSPSVDPFDSPDLPAHRALAGHGLVWIEGLDLAAVDPGDYLLVALPLPLVGAEAAPLRALLLPLESTPGDPP